MINSIISINSVTGITYAKPVDSYKKSAETSSTENSKTHKPLSDKAMSRIMQDVLKMSLEEAQSILQQGEQKENEHNEKSEQMIYDEETNSVSHSFNQLHITI